MISKEHASNNLTKHVSKDYIKCLKQEVGKRPKPYKTLLIYCT